MQNTPARKGRPAILTPEQRQANRRKVVAKAAAAFRARQKSAGIVELKIKLTAEQAAEFAAMKAANRYAPQTFDVRALILGAKFCANMSQGKRPVARKRGTGGVRVEF